ncbi:hypothetical protein, partial [Mesorhizobium sp.]|uniref:hypothetical protein n=1 Tax=Mesorhizobium sp. TaxID=1871066 RepID=UPI0025FF313A
MDAQGEEFAGSPMLRAGARKGLCRGMFDRESVRFRLTPKGDTARVDVRYIGSERHLAWIYRVLF